MACNSCRRKRCRCDSKVPCAPCFRTGDICVYSHQDRRRHRRAKSTVADRVSQQDLAQESVAVDIERLNDGLVHDPAGGYIIGKTLNSGTHDIKHVTNDCPGETACSRRIKLQDSLVSDSAMLQQAATTVTRNHQPSMITTLKRSDSCSDHPSKSVNRDMRDMQSKFRLATGPPTYRSHAGPRRILPQEVDGTANSDPQHEPTLKQQPSSLFVWQVEHQRGYPVPGYARTFGNLPFSNSITTNGYPPRIQARQALNFTAPAHLIFPLVEKDEEPLGRALIEFQYLGRRLIAEGTPSSQVADMGLTDVTLFFRNRLPKDPLSASTWTAEMLRSFRGTFSDELLLACADCVGKLLRWLLLPTPENYMDIPSMARPTTLQRLRPHPPWVDLMVFPAFRDALTRRSRDWVEPCLKANWKVLWPHSLEDALFRPANTERILISPKFADFIANPKNWSMQNSILEDFPEIRGSEINILQD